MIGKDWNLKREQKVISWETQWEGREKKTRINKRILIDKYSKEDNRRERERERVEKEREKWIRVIIKRDIKSKQRKKVKR